MQGVHAENAVYCFPLHIFSQDPDSEERRCGRLSFCKNLNGQWFGFAPFHLFTDSWKPNDFSGVSIQRPFGNLFDMNARVEGKACYIFDWVSDSQDITTDETTMRNVERIGTVVSGLPEHCMVRIRLFSSFTTSTPFQTQGKWYQFAGA